MGCYYRCQRICWSTPCSMGHTARRLAFVCYFSKAHAVFVWLGSRKKLALAGDVGIRVLGWMRDGSLGGSGMLVLSNI